MASIHIRPLRRPDDLPELDELFGHVLAATGHWPLGENKYIDLQKGSGEGSSGIVAVSADDHVLGYVHLAPNREPGGWGMELAVDPANPQCANIRSELLDAALNAVVHDGGRKVNYWLHNQAPFAELADHGFDLDRELSQMRRPLPLAEPAAFPAHVEVRGFESGDVEQWLLVNNLAFDGHPENGNWTAEVFAQRRATDWFDAEGFRTAWDGGRMAAFNWTKVHPDGVGEIYVIAVHPEYQGLGLGKAIALDGLQYLYEQRGCRTASLYVDSSNTGAIALYERLGFALDHTDRAFSWMNPAAGTVGDDHWPVEPHG